MGGVRGKAWEVFHTYPNSTAGIEDFFGGLQPKCFDLIVSRFTKKIWMLHQFVEKIILLHSDTPIFSSLVSLLFHKSNTYPSLLFLAISFFTDQIINFCICIKTLSFSAA